MLQGKNYSFYKVRQYTFIIEYVFMAFMCMLIIRKYRPSGMDFGLYLPLLIDIGIALIYSIIIYLYSGKGDQPTKIEIIMRVIYLFIAGRLMMETDSHTVQIIIILPTVIMALRYAIRYTVAIASVTTIIIIVNANIYNHTEFDYLFILISFIWVLGLLINSSMEEERRMQEELRKMHEKEHLVTIGEMAAGIAHEVRNPLASIKGFVQLLDRYRGVKEEEILKKYLSMIESEIDRMNDLLNDILLFAKPRKASLTISNINKIIKEIIVLMDVNCMNRKIEIMMDLSDDIPDVKCDRKQIKQVMLNIMMNAIDAVENSEKKKIVWKTTYDNQNAILEIQDTGCGMSQEQINKIFNPFYTTKEKGTGLGLSICKSIIESHMGELKVNSRINCGTTFVIILPVHK